MFRKFKNKRGFTLIELIVVLAVLALIASIAVPRFLGVQDKAKIDADYATGAMIAKAAELYLAQNEDATTVDKAALQLSDFKFKSTKIVGLGIDAVEITPDITSGSILVEVEDSEAAKFQIYPNAGALE